LQFVKIPVRLNPPPTPQNILLRLIVYTHPFHFIQLVTISHPSSFYSFLRCMVSHFDNFDYIWSFVCLVRIAHVCPSICLTINQHLVYTVSVTVYIYVSLCPCLYVSLSLFLSVSISFWEGSGVKKLTPKTNLISLIKKKAKKTQKTNKLMQSYNLCLDSQSVKKTSPNTRDNNIVWAGNVYWSTIF